ncbi:hypothetical protein PI124_g7561 [Phytophthora idaei]|nr:hypothetical protein PI125_g20633 [Phytophthora idaei]KAG3147131.1 hypothetical protein PI126_g12991 [Phytophthora idaei]KAG3247747.1 hypothetical protein PI124_g7561 [Phytophthora idaei]
MSNNVNTSSEKSPAMVPSSDTSARVADTDASTQTPGTAPLRFFFWVDAAPNIDETAAGQITASSPAPDSFEKPPTCATDANSGSGGGLGGSDSSKVPSGD